MIDFFSPAVRHWFEASFAGPTRVQAAGWPVIASGRHALLVAPTGTGKTLAAFLSALDTLSRLPGDAPAGVRVLYVSPLRALVYDVERNLRSPLAGIRRAAAAGAETLRDVRVDVRTGDTPAPARRQQARAPGDILVTTPESLFLILGSRARETLRTVATVIVDEVHALAPTKRGAHLALSLERLSELTALDPQRIGLSATVRPVDEVARYLGGDRPVEVVDALEPPDLDLEVVVPVADMERVPAPTAPPAGGSLLAELHAREAGPPASERGLWPAIYPVLVDLVRRNRSTILFVNSRGLCERLARRLNELAGEALVRAHHGSVSPEQRAEIEEGLKRGSVRGIVATSSLELGVDMGAVDLVVLVESPGSVARGLQRVGRAGHRVGAVSAGRLFPKFRGDLLECAVIARRMLEGAIEAVRVPRNPLDVLAQQVVAMCCDSPRTPPALAVLAHRAYSFRHLSADALTAVLDMLSGHYPSSALADLTPLLSWDRTADVLSPRRGAPLVSRLNAGTIPDRGTYAVQLGEGGTRVGELDEEMVFETRPGDNVLLGATTWRVESIGRDRVIVSPAPGEPGRLPFWRGEGPGRPAELGREVGAMVRALGALTEAQAARFLEETTPLDAHAARNLAAYVGEQKAHTGTLPTDRAVTVERFRDELGDWRVCILTPFGARIHAPWAMALERLLADQIGAELQVMYTDDGIVLRFADVEDLPGVESLFPDPEEVEGLVTEQLADSALFAGLFRENAARSLLLPRRRPDRRNPLWAQRLKARHLLAEVRRYPGFPVVLETYRQALADVFDLRGLQDLLARVRSRELRVDSVETPSASPFARSLVFAYVAAYIYEQDAPMAERKAQALTLDRALLAELLGQAELRDLIDAGALDLLERELQCLTPERRARDADQLHDVLRRLGDLSAAELEARAADDPRPWLARLEGARRAVCLRVAGQAHWVAAEDAGLYRDALGCLVPPGLPDAFLGPVPDPLQRLLRRYARGRGPFLTREPVLRYGLGTGEAEGVLRRLESDGYLVRGEIRPGGVELDWCDAEVLRRLKRLTLARLRRAVEPVEGRTLGRFLPAWQGVGAVSSGEPLAAAVTHLEGLPLPWSVLSENVLPARVRGFSPEALDALAASGAVVWVGDGALGPGDGRVVLYRRESVRRLLSPRAVEAHGEVAAAVVDTLARRGASFLVDLDDAVRRAVAGLSRLDFEAALWSLVWNGVVTNDTLAPLRSLRAGPRPAGSHARRLAGGRWSLVRDLVDPAVGETERAVARVEMLLERYGVVSREAARAEDLPGGFGPLYRVLREMEEAGRVRRGYFVEGLAAAQFARPGAVDRLRGLRPDPDAVEPPDDGEVVALAAMDPANPFGALLPWPDPPAGVEARARRVPGAFVFLVRGEPVLYAASGGRQLLTLGADREGAGPRLAAALRFLAAVPRPARRRALLVERVDGVPVSRSPLQPLLLACGFQPDYRGLSPRAPGG
jgi:ATP-dependent Lhr-like helicase